MTEGIANPPPAEGGSGPQFTKPAGSPGAGMTMNLNLKEMSKRWGVDGNPYTLYGLIAAGVGLALGTIGHIVYLTADTGETQSDGYQLLFTGIGVALGAAALMLLARWQSGGGAPGGDSQDDLRITGVLAGMALLWILLALIFGLLDDRIDAQDSWAQYSRLFAVLTLAWCVISRPFSSTVFSMNAATIGLIALGAAAVTLGLGMLLAFSSDFDTFTKGVTLENTGLVLVFLALAVFLGMRPREGA